MCLLDLEIRPDLPVVSVGFSGVVLQPGFLLLSFNHQCQNCEVRCLLMRMRVGWVGSALLNCSDSFLLSCLHFWKCLHTAMMWCDTLCSSLLSWPPSMLIRQSHGIYQQLAVALSVSEEECLCLLWQIFSFAWSSDGKSCATLCKDAKIRVFEPRSSTDPVSVSLTCQWVTLTFDLAFRSAIRWAKP